MTNEFKDHAWLAKPPIPIQRFMFLVLNPIGKLIGYKATYPKYTKLRKQSEQVLGKF
jgi:hypothetical protein